MERSGAVTRTPRPNENLDGTGGATMEPVMVDHAASPSTRRRGPDPRRRPPRLRGGRCGGAGGRRRRGDAQPRHRVRLLFARPPRRPARHRLRDARGVLLPSERGQGPLERTADRTARPGTPAFSSRPRPQPTCPTGKEMLNWGRDVPAGHPLRRRYPHQYADQVFPEADVPGITDVLTHVHDHLRLRSSNGSSGSWPSGSAPTSGSSTRWSVTGPRSAAPSGTHRWPRRRTEGRVRTCGRRVTATSTW